uniref:Uncharacterized protein n=1 Tax=Lygus hesperus TaxID=30085 RepID=A0A146M8D2_LYGHE
MASCGIVRSTQQKRSLHFEMGSERTICLFLLFISVLAQLKGDGYVLRNGVWVANRDVRRQTPVEPNVVAPHPFYFVFNARKCPPGRNWARGRCRKPIRVQRNH